VVEGFQDKMMGCLRNMDAPLSVLPIQHFPRWQQLGGSTGKQFENYLPFVKGSWLHVTVMILQKAKTGDIGSEAPDAIAQRFDIVRHAVGLGLPKTHQ
jgi:hypothetical protein